MNQLLFTLIFAEMAVILILSFKTQIRKVLITALDDLKKQGRALIIVKTIHWTLIVVLISNVYSILKIWHRLKDADLGNPAVQVLMVEKLITGSLTGFLLFLSMVIDILHQNIKECNLLYKIIVEDEKQLAERKIQTAHHSKALKKEIDTLKSKIKKLESEFEARANKAKTAQGYVSALREQSEGFHIEYDRLLEYNQTLMNQLELIDERLLEDNQRTGWVMNSGIGTSSNSRELGLANEVQSTNESHQSIFSCSCAISSPRHRRPIYQH